ncbi:MAG: DUF1566 domain-containing protein [Alistipes sp.]|nr:DUF1566 domain-containing protein [Alistipes sp.]
MENVGTNGYAWSSSSYAAGNVNAGMLNFNSGNVNPLNNGNRAIARAVRCVQHLHGAVFYLLAFGLRRREPDAPARRAEGRTICSGGRIWNSCLLGHGAALKTKPAIFSDCRFCCESEAS